MGHPWVTGHGAIGVVVGIGQVVLKGGPQRCIEGLSTLDRQASDQHTAVLPVAPARKVPAKRLGRLPEKGKKQITPVHHTICNLSQAGGICKWNVVELSSWHQNFTPET